jgi:hypothetical protein
MTPQAGLALSTGHACQKSTPLSYIHIELVHVVNNSKLHIFMDQKKVMELGI